MTKPDRNSYRVIGLMSGTSLDGVDIALVNLSRESHNWSFSIERAETFGYSDKWLKRITYNPDLSANELLLLNHEFGLLLAELILHFLQKWKISGEEVDLISSHGHTLFHQPEKGYTMQIGNGPEIYTRTGIPVVCDFRPQDVALEGQGAPLVPVGDALLFSEYEACVNLGGFANMSTTQNSQRIAFDICPVNFVLNELARKVGRNYDNNGEIARSGTVDQALLNTLNKLTFYREPHPKSIGAEWVEQHIYSLREFDTLNIPDLLATFTLHAANQIGSAIQQFGLSKVLFTGGGAFNSYLMELIQAQGIKDIRIPSTTIINYKEALVFALMGVLKMRGENNIYSSVTGARKDHSSGLIYN